MRYFLLLLIFIFLGCSGGDKDSTPTISTGKPINDPYFYQQWHLAKDSVFYIRHNVDNNAHVNGGRYYRYYKGRGVRIAIIDDGLDVYHPDLKGASIRTYNAVAGGTNVAHSGHIRDKYLGTLVTGIIAARANDIGVFGIASESEIMFLKHGNRLEDSQIAKLFKKAAYEFGADIINNSWGTEAGPTDAGSDIISYYAKNGRGGKGALIVFATGNENKEKERDESAIPGVIGVGATDKHNLRASYSNYGRHVDVVAPGGNEQFGILSLCPTYFNPKLLCTAFGTSLAAPIVSGALAMLLEANPYLTRDEVKILLKTTSDKIGYYSYGTSGHSIFYGYGKLNIARLLDRALGK